MRRSPAPGTVPFFGWHVVAATFLLAVFGWGVGFYGPPVFFYAVVSRTGWPVALVSAAVTLHFLVGAFVVANLPGLYQRLGVPRVTLLGATVLAIGILGWAVASHRWHLFLAATLSGAGWVAMGAAAVNALIAPWFSLRRPAALGMAYNGASLGGVIFSPLWIVLIGALGVVPAVLAVGGTMVAVVALLSFRVFARTPESLGQAPDGENAPPEPTRAAAAVLPMGHTLWRDRRFVTLAAGMMLGLFAQIGLLAHLFSVLVPMLGEKTSGLVMGGATVAAIAGRFAVGWLMPADADRRLVACLSYGLQLTGSVFLILSVPFGSLWLIPGIVLFGSGIGNATSLPPLIAQREFLPAETARVVPLIVAIGQAGYAFAPLAFGLLRAVGGGPQSGSGAMLLFLGAALVQGAAIMCFLLGRRRDPQGRRRVPARG
ncbi:MFS transporter [Phaeovulum sp. W22_SRMD_FR3]|uniref:MFS transporter n=1 Tax=Phaeovulum sp. W22_SRMD_FR3 TaxID=3240274 RepID=UPI003F98F56E